MLAAVPTKHLKVDCSFNIFTFLLKKLVNHKSWVEITRSYLKEGHEKCQNLLEECYCGIMCQHFYVLERKSPPHLNIFRKNSIGLKVVFFTIWFSKRSSVLVFFLNGIHHFSKVDICLVSIFLNRGQLPS